MSRFIQFVLFFFLAIVALSEAQMVCTGGEFDMWTNCGSQCPLTCGEPSDRACIQSCRPNTCQCASGYWRRWDGMCVLPNECDM